MVTRLSRLASPVVATASSQLLILVGSAGTNLLIARGYGATVRGQFAVSVAMVQLLVAFGGVGVSDSITRVIAKGMGPSHVRALLARDVRFIGVASLLGGFATYFWLTPSWVLALGMGGAVISLFSFRVLLAFELGTGGGWRFDAWRAVSVLAPLAAAAVLLAASTVNGYTLFTTASLGTLVLVAGPLGKRIRVHDEADNVDELDIPTRAKGAAAAGSSLALTAVGRLDILVVAAVLGGTDAGVYAIALAAIEVPLVLATSYAMYAVPEAAAGTFNTRQAVRLSIVSTFVGGLAVAGLLVPIAERVLGPSFEPVPVLVLVLVPGAAALAGLRVIVGALIGRGAAAAVTLPIMVVTALLVLVDVITLDSVGIVGAAAWSSVAYLCCFAVASSLERRLK